MQTDVTVYLDEAPLHKIDQSIILQKVDETAVSENVNTMSRGSGGGQVLTSRQRQYLDVTVDFCITTRTHANRIAILNRIIEWASAGRILTLSYRTGQRLRVYCRTLPALGYVRDWSNVYTMSFRTDVCPYWEDQTEQQKTMATSNEEAEFVVQGTAPTVLELYAKNVNNKTVDEISYECGGQRIAFRSLGLAKGETLCIEHDEAGYQRIYIIGTDGAERSAMSRRTPESADEIILKPGANLIAATSDFNAATTLRARGRYL